MCHLILLLPILALPIFWLVPLSISVPLYGLVLALAIVAYVLVFKAMQRPITAGVEALIHAIGTVQSVDRSSAYVWVVSESWSAICAEGVLAIGDTVEVIGREGLTLHVRQLAPSAGSILKKDSDHE